MNQELETTEEGEAAPEPISYHELNVMAEKCAECLFSSSALVDGEWRRELIERCQDGNSFFVCHRATMEGGLIVACRAFYDTQDTQPIQLAKRMQAVRFVKAEDLPKLNPIGRKTISPDIAFLLAMQGKAVDERE